MVWKAQDVVFVNSHPAKPHFAVDGGTKHFALEQLFLVF